ncbi:hypothetical protein [Vreelandella populi]|uniref:hypothetical protein n=1 Tax=Vreelandella populi TaxID=2498858 RepID=UPI000F8DC3F8|nr:hypothetical protein [Halomonas populi]RUR51530.1 hypothetical protein ELY40_17185 [Halomonas populi]
MKKLKGLVALALWPALALAGDEPSTTEGMQADVVARVATATAFKAAEDCYTRSVLARNVAVAKERGFERSRVIGMAGGNASLESMINTIYDTSQLDDDFDTAIFEQCIGDSKRRLMN